MCIRDRSSTDRLRRRGRAGHRRGVVSRAVAIQPVRRHERRALFPRWWNAVAGTARQRGRVGGDVVRREQKPRAPGLLTRPARRSHMRFISGLILVGSFLLAPAPALLAQAPVDPSGHWTGAIHIPAYNGASARELGIDVD